MNKKLNALLFVMCLTLFTFGVRVTNVQASENETTTTESCKLADTIKNKLGDTILDAEIIYKNEPYGITEGIKALDACDDSDFSILNKVIGQNYFNYELALKGDEPEQFILSLLPSKSEIKDFTGDIEQIVDSIDLPNALVDAGFLDDIDIKGTVEFNVPKDMNWNINSDIPTRFEFVTPDHFEIDTNIPDKITVEAELSDTTTGVITVSIVGIFVISSIALVLAIKKESY